MDNCRLVAISSPVIEGGPIDAEAFIAYTARVSNPANQNNEATADRLVRYLIKNKHWSPFEMVSMTIEINTTRDIARQILRHRSFSFQEFSQRYAEATEFVTRESRLQDPKNRQNSIESTDYQGWWQGQQEEVLGKIESLYKTALNFGIAKEQARAILPEGLTKSRLYMAGTVRSWIHYCDLRTKNGTQKEHMQIAQECYDILGQEFPNIVKALEENNENSQSRH